MSMTFNSLVDLVKDYLDRSDASTIDRIPDFINQSIQKISRQSKNIGFEVYVSNTFTVGVLGSVIPKPGRWRRTITFNYGSGTDNNSVTQLQLRSYEFIRNYWPNPTLTGAPLYYSDYGYDHFLIGPTPDQEYPFELAYLELPQPLSENVQTNWLTNYAPDVLLYGTLLEAVPYLKNDERIPVWQQKYDSGVSDINSQDDQRLLDRASNRSSD